MGAHVEVNVVGLYLCRRGRIAVQALAGEVLGCRRRQAQIPADTDRRSRPTATVMRGDDIDHHRRGML